MNLELRKKSKNYFDKDNNSVFGKTIENIQKRRDIKLVKTERRRNYLVSEQNYHTSSSLSSFTINLLAIEMRKTQILINKRFYLGLSILDLSKTIAYEFWHDYVKRKYSKKVKFCYMNTSNFLVLLKTDDIYMDIAEEAETRFDSKPGIMN